MLDVVWVILALVVAILLTSWITFTVTRLDRLHARVDAAQAALDAQLVRRSAALLHVAESPDSGAPPGRRPEWDEIAQQALDPARATTARAAIENAVGRAVAETAQLPRPLHPDAAAELYEAAARVRIARRFYNDAVRDTRALRARRMPRLLRLAGRRALPLFFDIDDTVPTVPTVPTASTVPVPPPKEDRP